MKYFETHFLKRNGEQITCLTTKVDICTFSLAAEIMAEKEGERHALQNSFSRLDFETMK